MKKKAMKTILKGVGVFRSFVPPQSVETLFRGHNFLIWQKGNRKMIAELLKLERVDMSK